MRGILLKALFCVTPLAWACAPPPASDAPAPPGERPRNVVFVIADGYGPAQHSLARAALGRPLALDAAPLGLVRTASANAPVTDSAAAATAYSCGISTNNARIGADRSGRPCETLLPWLSARGRATGAVTNTRITHATPAAFSASVSLRTNEASIAEQQIESPVDLLIGGGRREFLPAARGGGRSDELDLIARARARGRSVALNLAELRALKRLPALALIADSHFQYALDRDRATAEPDLREMLAIALRLLEADGRPFFLLLEAGRIDHAGHDNDPAALIAELRDYDAAMTYLFKYAALRGDTLLLATADHETGGLSLGAVNSAGASPYDFRIERLLGVQASAYSMAKRVEAGQSLDATLQRYAGIARLTDAERAYYEERALQPANRRFAIAGIVSARAGVGWSTYGHTGVDVGLFGAGPGAEYFRGVMSNYELGRRLRRLLGDSLDGTASPSEAR